VRVPAENRLPGANSFRDCAAVLIEVHFIAALQPPAAAVTIGTPEGDPGPMLTEIAAAEVGILVVGKERGQPMRHLARGSVSSYCCECSRCPVFVVPPAEGAGR